MMWPTSTGIGPSDFLREYGWGGREADDATWQPAKIRIIAR